jgi:hypothetical protein
MAARGGRQRLKQTLFLVRCPEKSPRQGCKRDFYYIDRAHREKLAIGCPSIHMTDSVTGFLQEDVSGDATP